MTRLLAKKWAIFLVLSLALNLFLAGMLTARWWLRPSPPPHHAKGMRVRSLERTLGRHLDPSVHDTLRRIDAERRDTIERRLEQAREAGGAAKATLATEQFDRARAEQAFADFRAKSAAAKEAMHEALIDVAEALPPEQRVKLGEAWERGPGPRGRRGWRGRPRD